MPSISHASFVNSLAAIINVVMKIHAPLICFGHFSFAQCSTKKKKEEVKQIWWHYMRKWNCVTMIFQGNMKTIEHKQFPKMYLLETVNWTG